MKRASLTRAAILSLGFTLVWFASSHAQPSSPPREVAAPHVAVSLIADPNPSPGALAVGLRFRLDPGWHVYWRNPGDSGGPPSVSWRPLPPGWSAGELSWPAPERIPLGTLVNYGYTGDVVLPVTFIAPRAGGGAGAGQVTLIADVRWLVCHDICVPGKATLGLQVPLPGPDQANGAEWSRLLADARRRVPAPAPKEWQVSARDQGDRVLVAVRGDGRIGGGVFFPIDEGVVNESAPQGVKVSGGEVRFTLRKSDQATAMPKVLRGVVRFESGAAYEVAAAMKMK